MLSNLKAVASGHPTPGQDFPESQSRFPFWCLMFFTFVLFIAPQGMFPSLAPLRLAKVSVALAAIAYVLNCLANRRPLSIITPEIRLVLWLLSLAVLSIPFSSWPGGSLDYLFSEYLKSVILFFLLANLLQTVPRMKLMLGSLILWGIFLSLNAIFEFKMGIRIPTTERIPGHFSPVASDPNDLALTLNIILSLTMGFFLATAKRLPKLLLLAVMALLAAGVVVSFSRGGFLALLAILAVFLIRQIRQRGPALLLALALLLLGSFLLPHGYADRVYSIYDTSLDPTGSADARWHGMVSAFWLMLQNPVIGLGLNEHGLSQPGMGGVHSAFLQVGADLGVPAFLIYVLLVWRLFSSVRRSGIHLGRFPGNQEVVALGMGIEIALVAFVVGGSMLADAYHFHFYYTAGFAVAFNEIAKRRRLAVANFGNSESAEPAPPHEWGGGS